MFRPSRPEPPQPIRVERADVFRAREPVRIGDPRKRPDRSGESPTRVFSGLVFALTVIVVVASLGLVFIPIDRMGRDTPLVAISEHIGKHRGEFGFARFRVASEEVRGTHRQFQVIMQVPANSEFGRRHLARARSDAQSTRPSGPYRVEVIGGSIYVAFSLNVRENDLSGLNILHRPRWEAFHESSRLRDLEFLFRGDPRIPGEYFVARQWLDRPAYDRFWDLVEYLDEGNGLSAR